MARRLVCVRLSEAGLAEIDGWAASRGTTRSDMIRVLLGMATAVMRAEKSSSSLRSENKR